MAEPKAKGDLGDRINQAISRKVLKLASRKRKKPDLEGEYKSLVGPLFLIGGKVICLLVLIPTAILEGCYVGLKHAATVLEKGM